MMIGEQRIWKDVEGFGVRWPPNIFIGESEKDMKTFKLDSPSLRQELKNLMDIRQKTYLFNHNIQRRSYLIYSEIFRKIWLIKKENIFEG